MKNAITKLSGKNVEKAPAEEKTQLKASALFIHVQSMRLLFKTIKKILGSDDVVVTGEVDKQADAEKIVLTLENIEGENTVDNIVCRHS